MPLDLETLVAPDRTALVLQEMQNGVVGEPSALPALAAAAAEVGLIPNAARLAAAARALGIPVVHCTYEAREDLRGTNTNARLFAGVRKSPVRLIPGSEAAAVPEEIGMPATDIHLPRVHGVGPVTGTQLDPVLRNLGVRTVVGVGVSVNIGMTDLAFTAVNLGYQVVFPRDAIAGVPVEYAAAVVENSLSLVVTLTTTDAVLAAWGSA